MILTLASDTFLDLARETLGRGGVVRFRAAGTSMAPFIRPGDVLFVQSAAEEALRPGDLVLYRDPFHPRVHRVTGVRPGALRVRGDAPGCPVEEISASDVLGRVTNLERSGIRIPLDRGAPAWMRKPLARIPGGRRLCRYAGLAWLRFCEWRDRDGADLVTIVRLCSPCLDADPNLAEEAPEWPRLVSVASAHDLAPLLHFQMARAGAPLPPESARILREAYYQAAARHAVLSRGLGPVLGALKTAGIPVMALKGADLAETVYPSPACRPMTDVDLLIRPGDLAAADRVLSALDYLPVDGCAAGIDPFLPASLSTLDYRSPDALLPPIHLHWHLVNTSVPTDAYRGHIAMEEIWSESLPFELAGVEVRRMAAHHLLVYLCEHALRPAHALSKPLHLTDLAWEVGAPGSYRDWDRVLDTARRYRLDRMAYAALSVLREWAGTPVPDGAIASLRPGRLTLGELAFLRGARRGRPRPGMSYLLHLALRRSPAAKVRFVVRTLFPSRPVVAHHAPEGGWGWYFHRAIEVVRHLLGGH